jgi:hypothetical protein
VVNLPAINILDPKPLVAKDFLSSWSDFQSLPASNAPMPRAGIDENYASGQFVAASLYGRMNKEKAYARVVYAAAADPYRK